MPLANAAEGVELRQRRHLLASCARLLGCRRLGVRYARRARLLRGLLHLACVLICLRFLRFGRGD